MDYKHFNCNAIDCLQTNDCNTIACLKANDCNVISFFQSNDCNVIACSQVSDCNALACLQVSYCNVIACLQANDYSNANAALEKALLQFIMLIIIKMNCSEDAIHCRICNFFCAKAKRFTFPLHFFCRGKEIYFSSTIFCAEVKRLLLQVKGILNSHLSLTEVKKNLEITAKAILYFNFYLQW